jgi:ribosomal protein S18 acetylase RimI-like enzyme
MVREADHTEIDQLAQLWFDAWHQSHARLAPPHLVRLRTLDNFRDRLQAMYPDLRVIGPLGAPVGFCALKGDELYQLFVAQEAHGSGVAQILLADAEARLADRGVETAWLSCAIGNDRAARFYEKSGWHRAGIFLNMVDTSRGPLPVENWRYERRLTSASSTRKG